MFDPVPGEGQWHWALLADGSIGIGGDPVRLLRRVAELVGPGGRALVEVSAHELDHRGISRVEYPDGSLGPAFPLAAMGTRALVAAATTAVMAPGRSVARRDPQLRPPHLHPC